jgi:hypothetical protein
MSEEAKPYSLALLGAGLLGSVFLIGRGERRLPREFGGWKDEGYVESAEGWRPQTKKAKLHEKIARLYDRVSDGQVSQENADKQVAAWRKAADRTKAWRKTAGLGGLGEISNDLRQKIRESIFYIQPDVEALRRIEAYVERGDWERLQEWAKGSPAYYRMKHKGSKLAIKSEREGWKELVKLAKQQKAST